MYIYNTTNLSEPIIRTIADLVRPHDTPTINSVQLRSKKQGIVDGNWGRFYPDGYRITVCVPQYLQDYLSSATYSNSRRALEDRYDFLALVIGHEYRHAWQWVNHPDWYKDKLKIELDAEEYELVALGIWSEYRRGLDIKEEAITQAVGRKLSYKDYRDG